MLDNLEEIFNTLKQNRLRAIMTGFSVAWGIFMLIVLLGSGQGLKNGMERNFGAISRNAIQVWPGQTGETFEGLKKGRQIQFTNSDFNLLSRELNGLEHITGRISLWQDRAIIYDNRQGIYSITGVMPQYLNIVRFNITGGRFVNQNDINHHRKVIVLSRAIVENLFNDEYPVGKLVKVGGIYFTVVGVLEHPTNNEAKEAIIPISTAQRIFNQGNNISNLALTTQALTIEENKKIEEELRGLLAQRHRFATTDSRALYIWNTLEDFSRAQGVFGGIRLFVWIIGIMTIIAGIVGVSNIMVILVKERTKEIGIRKAIGASPRSVVQMVLTESLLITIVAGFFGLMAGMGLLHLARIVIAKAAESNDMIRNIFYNPSADFGVALSALVVLVIAGLLAGFVPASKAAAIKPVEALHDE